MHMHTHETNKNMHADPPMHIYAQATPAPPPSNTFQQVSHLPPRQNNFQKTPLIPPPLDVMCIFSSIVNLT